MSSLKVQSYRHPKTGKTFITEAKLPLFFKGKNVEILINGPKVEVVVDGAFTGKTFERSVPFIQLLYYIIAWVEAQEEN